MVYDSTYIAQKQRETAQWDGKTMMKKQEVAILRVRAVFAFGEQKLLWLGKGMWRISGMAGSVLFLQLGSS